MSYHGKNGLYKTNRGKIVGGVCAGLSEYFKIYVTIIRILWVVFIFAFGSGLFTYIALWLLLPGD